MGPNRTVAVLGPIPFDRIITFRGDILEKYGCALYTVAALSALLDEDDRICPVVHVRKRDEEAINELLSQFPQVDLKHGEAPSRLDAPEGVKERG
jgi:hypothetical protein